MASCTNVAFVKPQPEGIKALTEIPENLQGTYVINDSIIVKANAIGEDTLGKTLVVKKRGNFYYLNFKEEEVYELTVVKVVQCLNYEKIEMFHPKISDDNQDKFKVIEVKSKTYGTEEVKEYIVDNVSITQLSKMLSKDKNNFKLTRIK
ncbi:MAG: hypothetical protein HOL74_02410 [Flavobacteriales bacterium]|nr:hypothetical protein [Flavobacteriales bacterium]